MTFMDRCGCCHLVTSGPAVFACVGGQSGCHAVDQKCGVHLFMMTRRMLVPKMLEGEGFSPESQLYPLLSPPPPPSLWW